MTPEQWIHVTARLQAVEALAIAIAQTVTQQDQLQAALASQKAIIGAVSLNTMQPDDQTDHINREMVSGVTPALPRPKNETACPRASR